MSLGLYVHIPFCRHKCLYCDFPSYAGLEHLYSAYVAALCREISEQGGVLSGTLVDTVFIGGGTPSVLTGRLLGRVMDSIRQAFNLDKDTEVSIEANPGTIDKITLEELRQCGVNRISFGIQSFSDKVLAALGRIHTSRDAVQSIVLAQDAGFANMNLDLMYGLPGQSLKELRDSLAMAYRLNISHLSVYGLKVEEGTVFAELADQGRLNLPDDELDDAMYETVMESNAEQGFIRYEISNFSLPGRQCRHNLKYWHYQPYLGVGAAAHSFIDGQRRANVKDVVHYMNLISHGQPPVEFVEKPDRQAAMAEFCFLALRTVSGLSVSSFEHYFDCEFFSVYQPVVDRLKRKGAIVADGDYIRLTALGMKFGNRVFSEFI